MYHVVRTCGNPLGVGELEPKDLALKPASTIYCVAVGESLGLSELLFLIYVMKMMEPAWTIS